MLLEFHSVSFSTYNTRRCFFAFLLLFIPSVLLLGRFPTLSAKTKVLVPKVQPRNKSPADSARKRGTLRAATLVGLVLPLCAPNLSLSAVATGASRGSSASLSVAIVLHATGVAGLFETYTRLRKLAHTRQYSHFINVKE